MSIPMWPARVSQQERRISTGLACSLVFLLATNLVAQARQPTTGGTVRIGDWAEPVGTLNPYFAPNAGVKVVVDPTLEGLARVGPDGTYAPVLAATIPSQASGDVSPDGTMVTWKLKPSVTWS